MTEAEIVYFTHRVRDEAVFRVVVDRIDLVDFVVRAAEHHAVDVVSGDDPRELAAVLRHRDDIRLCIAVPIQVDPPVLLKEGHRRIRVVLDMLDIVAIVLIKPDARADLLLDLVRIHLQHLRDAGCRFEGLGFEVHHQLKRGDRLAHVPRLLRVEVRLPKHAAGDRDDDQQLVGLGLPLFLLDQQLPGHVPANGLRDRGLAVLRVLAPDGPLDHILVAHDGGIRTGRELDRRGRDQRIDDIAVSAPNGDPVAAHENRMMRRHFDAGHLLGLPHEGPAQLGHLGAGLPVDPHRMLRQEARHLPAPDDAASTRRANADRRPKPHLLRDLLDITGQLRGDCEIRDEGRPAFAMHVGPVAQQKTPQKLFKKRPIQSHQMPGNMLARGGAEQPQLRFGGLRHRSGVHDVAGVGFRVAEPAGC